MVVPEIRGVQEMPSGEVRMVPPPPTATSCVPVHATELSGWEVGKRLRLVQMDWA